MCCTFFVSVCTGLYVCESLVCAYCYVVRYISCIFHSFRVRVCLVVLCCGYQIVNELSKEIHLRLRDHPINIERAAAGKAVANVVLLRGCGVRIDVRVAAALTV